MNLSTGLRYIGPSRPGAAIIDLLLTFRMKPPPSRDRQGLSMSIVIDKSGSMSGAPIKNATQAAELLVRQLGALDTLSVVAYDHSVDTVVPPTQVVKHGDIAREIRKIRASGSTALHAGWVQGCNHAAAHTGDRIQKRVLLLTDGQANSGETDPKRLQAQAKAWAAKGVVTTTLGFGTGFNEDLLIGMAEASGGNFYYIETPADAAQVFLIEGESLTSLSAHGLTLHLQPQGGTAILDILNRLPTEPGEAGWTVRAGDVYGGEEKQVAIRLEVPLDSAGKPMLGLRYSWLTHADGKGATPQEADLQLDLPAGPLEEIGAKADFDMLRELSRIQVARSKEEAVQKADAGDRKGAATTLQKMAADLKVSRMDADFDFAEEVAQLEWFADNIGDERSSHSYEWTTRKLLRDQAWQGRTRSRSDLNARGSGGGSAKSLKQVKSAEGKVELRCEKVGGKLKIKVVSEGYDSSIPVLFPRDVREEGVSYAVDGLEPAPNGTFYRATGEIRRLAPEAATRPAGGADKLALDDLFQGGGEPWLPLLKPVIEAQRDAADFIGTGRDSGIVPLREMTFQALKPNPPEQWKVVVFGQNPYPRVESATGIAMFDNSFNDWKDSLFGRVTSIRCIIKAAAMAKHGVPKATSIADIRALLAKNKTVQPPAWFQAMLTQGVLLLNASLTASTGSRADANDIARHTTFWKPVVEKIVEEILRAKHVDDAAQKGVVFAWWGTSAKALRKTVEQLQKKYPSVQVRHVDHCNPAAQGDMFCDGDHFNDVNKALTALKMDPIDWLPGTGWDKTAEGEAVSADAARMGSFITQTMDMHAMYLKRLQEVVAEAQVELPPITGVAATPLLPLLDSLSGVLPLVQSVEAFAKKALDHAQRKVANSLSGGLTLDQIAAIYLYTCESPVYQIVNTALRDPERKHLDLWLPYLKLLLSSLEQIPAYTGELWRGVGADMRSRYPKGGTITWWGISSCTGRLSVAYSFLGTSGKRTLFEIRTGKSVGIRAFSAFTGEDEYLLAPGTKLKVVDVTMTADGLCTIQLEESDEPRGVS